MISLALVPEESAGDVYTQLLDSTPDYDCLQDENGFLDYFTKTYIERDDSGENDACFHVFLDSNSCFCLF